MNKREAITEINKNIHLNSKAQCIGKKYPHLNSSRYSRFLCTAKGCIRWGS